MQDAGVDDQSSAKTSREARAWSHRPATPIPLSPIMDWPPKPAALGRWFARHWLALGAVTLNFAFAWLVFAFLQPDMAAMETLGFGWAFRIWARNMALLILVAGGLHLWFYSFTAQGKKLKFDHRDFAKNNKRYAFRDQVRDNMFWSLASGVTFWSAFEIFYWHAAANGHAPGLDLAANPLWGALWFALLPIWSSFHFYWAHRLLHWPPLYRLAHSLHHKNVNIGPWTGISMHPVEHVLYFSAFAIHFVVPSHPVHVLFHFYNQALSPAYSHAGFEAVFFKGAKRLAAGDFFHQLHHRYFECNYGTSEMPWDRLFGSFHDGSDAATRATRVRTQKMRAGQG